jgi:hypothetical protein
MVPKALIGERRREAKAPEEEEEGVFQGNAGIGERNERRALKLGGSRPWFVAAQCRQV